MTKTNHSILLELSFTTLFLLVRGYINLTASFSLVRKTKKKQLRREICLHDTWEAINYKFSLWSSSFCLSPFRPYACNLPYSKSRHLLCDIPRLFIGLSGTLNNIFHIRTLTVWPRDYLIKAVAEALFRIYSSWTDGALLFQILQNSSLIIEE
jgi:hypothetical protein